MRGIRWLLAVVVLVTSAQVAAQGTDFMAGRLYQVALGFTEGFSPAGEITFGELNLGVAQHIEQTLQAGFCYVWIAVANAGQTDLDLAVYVGGAQVAGDSAPDDWPVARYCTATEVQARIDLLMYTGSGGFAFNTYSKYVGGADQIEVLMNYHSGEFAPGQAAQGPIARAFLQAGGEQTFSIPLATGLCYTIIGVSGAGVEDIDFFLMDPAGLIVDRDEAVDNYPVVGTCPGVAGTYTLRAAMYRGGGELGWRLFASAPQ